MPTKDILIRRRGAKAWPLNLTDRNITFDFDGGGAIIVAGSKVGVVLPFACTILQWTALSVLNESGSITFDLWKDTYANHPPVVADTIIAGGGTKPNITAATKGQSASLTNWTTALAEGVELYCNVDSASGLTRARLELKVRVDTST